MQKKSKVKNPFKGRDLHTKLQFPVISWSSYSAFVHYDKEEWYKRYFLGIRSAPNSVMQGGIDVGEKITQDIEYLKEIPRPEIFEQEFFGKVGTIDITGHLDGWSPKARGIDEYKTTCNPKRWTQKAVDEWGQITFYCLLVWINKKIRPEDLTLRLFSIPMVETGNFKVTQKGKPKMFYTKRTMVDLLRFMSEISKVHIEMLEYVKNHD